MTKESYCPMQNLPSFPVSTEYHFPYIALLIIFVWGNFAGNKNYLLF